MGSRAAYTHYTTADRDSSSQGPWTEEDEWVCFERWAGTERNTWFTVLDNAILICRNMCIHWVFWTLSTINSANRSNSDTARLPWPMKETSNKNIRSSCGLQNISTESVQEFCLLRFLWSKFHSTTLESGIASSYRCGWRHDSSKQGWCFESRDRRVACDATHQGNCFKFHHRRQLCDVVRDVAFPVAWPAASVPPLLQLPHSV